MVPLPICFDVIFIPYLFLETEWAQLLWIGNTLLRTSLCWWLYFCLAWFLRRFGFKAPLAWILKQGLKKVALTPGLEKVIWNVFSHIEYAISPTHSNVCFGFHAFLLHQYWKRLQTYSHFSWVLLLKMPDGKFLSWLLFNCLSKII